ncbi:unnamed protein product [Mytilus edulis]|uniref:Ig-like domain-containing protein n=1 Tax=Mytilus edulis TaxID=6550 RepID=A0A8S3QXL2_MYTED|nr:unnamed protein product [Mytilus edulis]
MPTITRYPNNSYYIVDEATSINLTCKSNGNPKPNYQWYKENINEPVSTSANWTITDINVTNSGVYTCNVSNTFNGDTHRNAKQVQINIMNKDDIPTTQSSTSCSSSCVGKKEERSKGNHGNYCYVICLNSKHVKRTSKSPTFKNVSKSSDDSKPKLVTEPRTGDYETIPLGDDAPKTKSSNYGFEADDINMHNAENTPPQPAVYAQVNEASKLKNKQKTEAIDSIGNQEEDTYAETQEGVYDKAGDRRHKEKRMMSIMIHLIIQGDKQNSNGDSKLAIQTSQVGSYANQGFEKDDNRKVATVSPTVRSSSGSQNDEQTNSNRNSQFKKGTKIL